ncbi:alcohol dehydrogenase-like protein [Myriangium duriaei CBS 260.36]|uniref:Alcohol dehydrogenase-like protein n=1 Tax=Myriangium duriaei CBS 260.36 TaxID=1168546 RepID=A0A9P4IVM1_9PEZI|nr:alcohol dehydrogenase-like protein [Myriangium duriaei CBS 260.36]
MPSTLPEFMKAQVLEAFNQPYVLKTFPIPEVQSENDIIVKVDASGYCHFDAQLAAGQAFGDPKSFPHIGGHEIAGTVVALPHAPSTSAKAIKIGSRVGVPGRGFSACHTCFECKSPANAQPGYSFYCQQGKSNGLSKHGGFAEYALVDARQCVLLPDGMQAVDAAPLMCAGVTIYKAIKTCKLAPGQRLGIVGCGGGLGHLGLQFADALGLEVTGIDAADGPLKLAKSLQTKAQIYDARLTSAQELAEEIGRVDGKQDKADMGLDAVIILPESQVSFEYGTKLLRNHALCVVVSIPEKGFNVSAWDLVYRNIKVSGTMLGSDADLRETVSIAAQYGVKPSKKIFSLAQINDLVHDLHNGVGGKMVIDLSL